MNELISRLRELHRDFTEGRWRQKNVAERLFAEAADEIERLETQLDTAEQLRADYHERLGDALAEQVRLQLRLGRVLDIAMTSTLSSDPQACGLGIDLIIEELTDPDVEGQQEKDNADL